MNFRPQIQAVALALGIIFLVANVVISWRSSIPGGARPLAIDFGYFYCAGATANANNNPYLTVPYDACGNGRRATPPMTANHRGPAPIPGYDVALFKVIAKIPFPAAVGLWLFVSVTAAVLGILAVASMTGIPSFIVFLTVAIGLRETLQWGQLVPILFAALALTAYALGKKQYVLAGVAATVALIEPHVGVPAFIATFLWVPRARVTLLVGAACLALISILTLGIFTNVEYLRVVLPSQVLAEAPAKRQYSLTWLLYALGSSERSAIRIADIQYAITTLCAILIARPLALRLNSVAIIPLVAAGFSVIGGPFVHLFQVAPIGILLALFLAGRRNDALAWVSILLLAVSWDGNLQWLGKVWSPGRFECAIIVAALTTYALRRRAVVQRNVVAVACFVAYMLITAVILSSSQQPTRVSDTPAHYISQNAAARSYSTVEWGAMQRTSANVSAELVASKIPTWLGLLLLFLSTLLTLRSGAATRPTAAWAGRNTGIVSS